MTVSQKVFSKSVNSLKSVGVLYVTQLIEGNKLKTWKESQMKRVDQAKAKNQIGFRGRKEIDKR